MQLEEGTQELTLFKGFPRLSMRESDRNYDREHSQAFSRGFRKREARNERGGETEGIYLLVTCRGSSVPSPRMPFLSLSLSLSLSSFLLKCRRREARRTKRGGRGERGRGRETKASPAKYENPYSRAEKISVI